MREFIQGIESEEILIIPIDDLFLLEKCQKIHNVQLVPIHGPKHEQVKVTTQQD